MGETKEIQNEADEYLSFYVWFIKTCTCRSSMEVCKVRIKTRSYWQGGREDEQLLKLFHPLYLLGHRYEY